jgi:DNA polymerase
MPTRDELFEELGIAPVFVSKNRKAGIEARNVPTAQPAMALPAPPSVAVEGQQARGSNDPTPPAPQPTPELPKPESSPPLLEGARAQRIAQMSMPELVADIAQCTACKLCATRTNTVPGVGAIPAQWMVIGEAPGADEDASGEPFVGRAGKLLDAMLRSVDRSRATNAFVANTLKCRPPNNRNPEPDELEACAPYLARQIELIQPKLIVTFGKFAIQWITGSDEAVGAMRGKTYTFQNIPVRVTYHPAYLLRSPGEKAKSWQDLLSAKKEFG